MVKVVLSEFLLLIFTLLLLGIMFQRTLSASEFVLLKLIFSLTQKTVSDKEKLASYTFLPQALEVNIPRPCVVAMMV